MYEKKTMMMINDIISGKYLVGILRPLHDPTYIPETKNITGKFNRWW